MSQKIKKSVLKQYAKYFLQKTILPFCYLLNSGKSVDERLVLFADSNGNTPPESMTLLIEELTDKGYKCEPWCCDFSRAGLVGMMRFMCRFMKRYAAAGTLVICNYFVPAHACKKRPETKVIQLWHSCGAFKKFGYSSENDISSHYRGSVSKNIDLVTVSSPECESVYKEAFGLSDGVARAVGVSRTDVFFDEEYKKRCREKLYRLYPETRGKRLLLYLPTFRGDASRAYSTGHEEIILLGKRLSADGWYTAVRMHPRIKDGITDLSKLTTNELMLCADMLITDYSSVIFEYALLRKPMLLWCPDLEEYTAQRDFYLDFRKDIPCPIVTNEKALEQEVKAEYESFTPNRYDRFLKRYMSACDGKATERIAEIISDR